MTKLETDIKPTIKTEKMVVPQQITYKFDSLGILTPATSPKIQLQQQQLQAGDITITTTQQPSPKLLMADDMEELLTKINSSTPPTPNNQTDNKITSFRVSLVTTTPQESQQPIKKLQTDDS